MITVQHFYKKNLLPNWSPETEIGDDEDGFIQKEKIHSESILIENKPDEPPVPDNMWAKCPNCKHIIYTKDIGEEKISVLIAYNFRISAWQDSASDDH